MTSGRGMASQKTSDADEVGVTLVRIRKTREHAEILYELLKKRTHSISHQALPNFSEHLNYVLNHPYRAWYLVALSEKYVGAIYILKSNCIGVSVVTEEETCIPSAIALILKKFKPLPAIKSVRAAEFEVNVAPTNKVLVEILNAMGANLAQVTYVLSPTE